MNHTTNPPQRSLPSNRPWNPARLRSRLAPLASTRALLIGLVLIGIGLRLWFIALNPIDASSSTADDGDYYRRALRLAVTGAYVDDSWLIRPPGHIFFFALWLRVGALAGDYSLGVLLVKLADVLVGAAQVLLGFGVARRLFRSEWAGLLYAAFLALWFPFIEQPSLFFSELLYGTLFMAHLWFLMRYDENEHWRELVLAGVFLGMAALTRSPALYSLAFVGMWLVLRRWKFAGWRTLLPSVQQVILPLVVIIAACLVIVLPWTARNYLTYQHFIPVDTLGQINIWLDLEDAALRNGKIEQLRQLPQADRAAYAMARAREILAEDPLSLVRNLWPNFRHVWKAQFTEDYYLRESFYDRPLRPFAPIGLAGDLLWLVFVGAGLAGLVARPREGWHNRLFALAWIGYTLFTVIVFHVEPRYLLPLWTLIALYGAGQLASLRANAEAPRWWLAPQLAALLVFALLLVSYRNYPEIIARGEAREQAMRAGDAAFARGAYAEAEQAYTQALAAQPNFADANVQRALAQLAQGKREAAAASVDSVNRRTAWLVGLVATNGTAGTADLSFAEATTGLDIQRWLLTWTQPQPARQVVLGDGRDMGYIAGFAPAESDGAGSFRWMNHRGSLRIPLAEPLAGGEQLSLRIASPGRDTTLHMQLGSQQFDLPIAAGGWRVYTLPIPAELAGQTTLRAELSAPTFIPAMTNPESTDLRQLSVMISSIYLP